MAYSVIIAERNEPDLAATCANIRANSNAHVIVMSDRKGLGPQAMRDKGIELAAGSEVVIIMDGHMRVKAGTLDKMAAYCAANPTTVATTYCHHSYEQDWTGKPYAGASFAWTANGKDASEPQSFTAKWRTDRNAGQIPCIMGACYGFTRDWYRNGLQRPWQYGTGWGCDEEILSAATWLRGGKVELLPLAVWHQARKPGLVPYKMTDMQLLGVWANRLRILDMLPMSTDERAELVKHIGPTLNRSQWRQVNAINDAAESAAYNKFLANGPMSWANFKQEMIGVQTVKQASPVIPPKKVEKKPRMMANWGADEKNNAGKRCCVHCGGGVTTVNRTMRAGKLVQRYRNCSDCDKNFPTREILTMS